MRNILFLLTLCIIASCKPKGEPEPTVNKTVAIKNNDDAAFTFRFFNSRQDYSENKNVVVEMTLEPKASGDLDLSVFTNDSFFCDFYNDQYLASNWLNGQIGYNIQDVIRNGSVSLRMSRYCEDSVDAFFLDDDRSCISWHATDYYNASNTSTWHLLPDYDKHLRIVLKKDGTYQVFKKNSSNEEVVITGAYQRSFSMENVLEFTDMMDSYQCRIHPFLLGVYPSEYIVFYTAQFRRFVCIKD